MDQDSETNSKSGAVPGSIERVKMELASLRAALLRRGEDRGGVALALDRLRAELSAAKSDTGELRSELSLIKPDISDLRSEMSSLKSDIVSLKEGETSLSQGLGTLRVSFEERSAELGADLASRLAALDSSLRRSVETMDSASRSRTEAVEACLDARLDQAHVSLNARTERIDAALVEGMEKIQSLLLERATAELATRENIRTAASTLAERLGHVESATRRLEALSESLPFRWYRKALEAWRGRIRP